MALKYKHTLLLVDDEESITNSLQRVFRKEGYKIRTASSGQEGLKTLQEAQKPFSLIISDQRMPEMTGAQFLEKAKKIFPNAMRILLTGYSDMDAIVDAVNKGEIHRYLTKPWNDDDLVLQVRQSLEQYELIVENRRLLALTKRQNQKLREWNKHLEKRVEQRSREIIQKNRALRDINKNLEKSFLSTIRLLSSLVETLNPVLGRYMMEVAQLARDVGGAYGLDKKALDTIEIAGMTHDIGLIGMPERVLQKNEEDMSEKEFTLFRQHPSIGQICLQSVESLNEVGTIVLSHHEHYDGSGFPSGLQGKRISLGARIISVVGDYCKIINTWPKDVDQILARSRKYIGTGAKNIITGDRKMLIEEVAQKIIQLDAYRKYDPDVVEKFVKRLSQARIERKHRHEPIVFIPLEELKEGMVLARNLRSRDGKFLLARGVALNKSLISTICKLGKQDIIAEEIHVTV